MKKTVNYIKIVSYLSWEELKQRYRRSKLGPNWITISLIIQIVTMGFVFSSVFKIGTKEYLLYISIGMVLWAFMSASIQTSCNSLISSGHLIRQIPFPIWGHILRNQIREIYVVGHNFLLLPIIYFLGVRLELMSIALAIIGFLIVVINMLCISVILSIVAAGYRDVGQMIGSVLQVIFYATPIMWRPGMLDANINSILIYNPFYLYIEVVRGSLLNQGIDSGIYFKLIILTAVIAISACLIYKKNQKKIAYWV